MSASLDTVLELKDWRVTRSSIIDIGPWDFTLKEGEVVTFMGPSGVGKTTVLLSALGYVDHTLSIQGTRHNGTEALAPGAIPMRALYIPQHLPFNPNWEVLGFLCRLPWGVKDLRDILFPARHSRRTRVLDVLRALNLENRARATIAELSGGEAQRAALAQMILLKPKLLVGDEFVSALDPGMATWVLEEFTKAVKRDNGAAMLALHNVQSALQVSDRIFVVWPPSLSAIPWEIDPNSPAWHSDVLHTLLCLARWSGMPLESRGPRLIAAKLESWLRCTDQFNCFATQFTKSSIVELLDDGSAIAIDDAISYGYLPEPRYASDHWTDMFPFQTNIASCGITGLVLPRQDNAPPLYLVAGNSQQTGIRGKRL